MLRKQKLWTLSLAILLLLNALPVLALSGNNPSLELGNTPTNSLHGGMMLTYGNSFFWADHTGIYDGQFKLTDEPGRHLNVMSGGLYFTVENEVTDLRRLDLESGEIKTVLSWPAPIDQLFIINDGITLFVSEERVYEVRLQDQITAVHETSFPVTRFIPTAHGTIYATGSLGNFTLYAEDRFIESGVALFFTEDDDLIIRRSSSDYQVPLRSLFTDQPLQIVAYEPRVDVEALSHIALAEIDPEDCPDCTQELDPFLTEGDILPRNLAPIESTTSLPLTQSQQNIVRRARQQLEIRWTPLQDIFGWRRNSVFRAGETYIGIPYGQPIHSGRYIPWGASFERFANAVQDINSPMYTSFSFNGTHATQAPFYSSDCSSFVSWSLNQPRRTTTISFPNYAHRITRSLAALQVGDVLNSPGHNILVTAVEFDANGNLAAIETMEQTIPLPRHRRYGVGGDSGGLANLMHRMDASGYHFYRTNIHDVPFTPNPAVNVEDGQRHIVTAIAGQGGVISPAGLTPVPHGTNQRFVFHPNHGFSVSRVLVNGVSVGNPTSFTVQSVTEAARIEVEFALTSSPFTDVSEAHWFHDAVLYVFREGLILGTSDTQFSPNVATSRGMFVTILGRMAGIHPPDFAPTGTVTGSIVNIRSGPGTTHSIISTATRGTTVEIIGSSGNWYRIRHIGGHAYISRDFVTSQAGTFSDVSPGAFYAPYVEWAYRRNIASGTGGTRFSPSTAMTRQEMATLLHRYASVMGINLPQTNVPAFADIHAVDTWAQPAVTALQRAGILSGTGTGEFLPRGTSDRASVASMIQNFHQIAQR